MRCMPTTRRTSSGCLDCRRRRFARWPAPATSSRVDAPAGCITRSKISDAAHRERTARRQDFRAPNQSHAADLSRNPAHRRRCDPALVECARQSNRRFAKAGCCGNPDSGQYALDLGEDRKAGLHVIAASSRRSARAPAGKSADEALRQGLCARGRGSGRRTGLLCGLRLEIEPEHVEARINLGRLLHMGGRLGEAEQVYRAAANPIPAVFNLAMVLEDLIGSPTRSRAIARHWRSTRNWRMPISIWRGCMNARKIPRRRCGICSPIGG